MESLAPALVDDMELLVDLMPADTHVLVLDPERARARAHDLVATSEEFLAGLVGCRRRRRPGAGRPRRRVVPLARPTCATTALERGLAWWSVSPFGIGGTTTRDRARLRRGLRDELGEIVSAGSTSRPGPCPSRVLPARPAPEYRGDIEPAIDRHPGWLGEGYRVVVVHPGHGPAQRLVEVLGEHDVAGTSGRARRRGRPPGRPRRHRHQRGAPARFRRRRRSGSCCSPATTSPGQRVHPRHAADADAAQAADRPARAQGRRLRRARAARGGSLRRDDAARGRPAPPASTSCSSTAPSKRGGPPDRLFVPTDALDQVTRYVGGEQPEPRPARRLRTGHKRKGRARKAVREIAAELIKLYAARQATKGYAFGPDTPWQRELEDAFPFVETADQLGTRRRGQGRHAPDGPDGPAGLRRRRLRQDRDRGAGGVQGRAGRQAGRRPRADDAAGAAAPVDVRRADGRLPGRGQGPQPLPDRRRGDAR